MSTLLSITLNKRAEIFLVTPLNQWSGHDLFNAQVYCVQMCCNSRDGLRFDAVVSPTCSFDMRFNIKPCLIWFLHCVSSPDLWGWVKVGCAPTILPSKDIPLSWSSISLCSFSTTVFLQFVLAVLPSNKLCHLRCAMVPWNFPTMSCVVAPAKEVHCVLNWSAVVSKTSYLVLFFACVSFILKGKSVPLNAWYEIFARCC